MHWITLLMSVAVVFTSLTSCRGLIYSTRLKCPQRLLKGGRVRIKSRGNVAKYVCLRGYQVLGNKYSICIRGKWDSPVPVCISGGCLPIDVPHAQVLETYKGAYVTVHCDPGYSLIGTQSLYCNGYVWNDTAPICREIKTRAQKQCDFETEDLCGWNHGLNHDFDWRRHNFATPSGHVGTGPSFDHTLGPGLNGHYLYLETSSPRLENDTARLFSPIFPAPDNPNSCFILWYHMFGLTTGSLNVYFHNQNTVLMFSKSGDQGDEWRKAVMPLPHVTSNFQIVIEGVRGTGYEGDIAIDDVKLSEGEECGVISTPIMEESSQTSDDASCDGRCFSIIADPSKCECTADCISNNTCCPDYLDKCIASTTVPVSSEVNGYDSSSPAVTTTTERQHSYTTNTSLPGTTTSTTTKSAIMFSSNTTSLHTPSAEARTPSSSTVQPTTTVVTTNKRPLLTGTEKSFNTTTIKPDEFSTRNTQTNVAKNTITVSTMTQPSIKVLTLLPTTTYTFRTATLTPFILFPNTTSSAAPSTVGNLQPLTPKVVDKNTAARKIIWVTFPPFPKKTTSPYQPRVPLMTSTIHTIRQKLEFITPPPPIVFWTPKRPAYKQVTKQQQKINVSELSTSTLNPKPLMNFTQGVAKSKNDILHPVWNKEAVTVPVRPTLTSTHRLTTRPGPKPTRVFTVTPSTLTRPTSMINTTTTTAATTGSKWKYEYKSKDQTPVHAQYARSSSSPDMMNIIVLTGVVLFILSVVLVTVCVVRKNKINRRSIEDDELDIRFLASDEILDFTLARPSQDDMGVCETVR